MSERSLPGETEAGCLAASCAGGCFEFSFGRWWFTRSGWGSSIDDHGQLCPGGKSPRQESAHLPLAARQSDVDEATVVRQPLLRPALGGLLLLLLLDPVADWSAPTSVTDFLARPRPRSRFVDSQRIRVRNRHRRGLSQSCISLLSLHDPPKLFGDGRSALGQRWRISRDSDARRGRVLRSMSTRRTSKILEKNVLGSLRLDLAGTSQTRGSQ